ncbi:MAG: DinB family protein [Phycisphaerales bacterium]
MDRSTLLHLWNAHHAENTWVAAWSKSVAGLTPGQAAWKPAPERHSIWQLVHHMVFWREYFVARRRGGATLAAEEIARRNWEEPAEVTDGAWAAALARFESSHAAVAAAIADPSIPFGPFVYPLTHDCYHVGQIMQVRAMQGLAPIE